MWALAVFVKANVPGPATGWEEVRRWEHDSVARFLDGGKRGVPEGVDLLPWRPIHDGTHVPDTVGHPADQAVGSRTLDEARGLGFQPAVADQTGGQDGIADCLDLDLLVSDLGLKLGDLGLSSLDTCCHQLVGRCGSGENNSDHDGGETSVVPESFHVHGNVSYWTLMRATKAEKENQVYSSLKGEVNKPGSPNKN